MSSENTALETLEYQTPRYVVEIENKQLEPNISIIDVAVEEKINEGASFKININDEFKLHDRLSLGDKTTIKMGYANNLHPIMVGTITSLEPNFFIGEKPKLCVEGHDLSYDYIKRSTPERTFVDQAYSDIARTIISEAGLLPVIDDTGKFEVVLRKDNDKTYFSFLEDMARLVSYKFWIDGQTAYFVKPEYGGREILCFEFGKDIISFRPNLRSANLVAEVEVRGHNVQDPEKPFIGRASAGSEFTQESGKKSGSQIAEDRFGNLKKVISNIMVTSEEHANAVARSFLNKASDSLIQGEGETHGMPQIRTGVNIRLEKMGERFSGKYYVIDTTHTISNSGYRTRFFAKRNAV